MLMISAAGFLGAFVLGMWMGAHFGRDQGAESLWQRLLSDRELGTQALEQLAQSHGAKLELMELPGGDR